MDKPPLREHPGVLEHFKPLYDARRPLLHRDALQLGDLRLDLLSGNQVFSPQLLQLLPSQPSPPAKFNQLVVVGLGEVPIPHPIPATPLDVLPVPLGRLEIVFVIRRDPVQLPHGLGLQLHRPGGQALVYSDLQPLIDILFCAFQRSTFRVVLLDVLDKILCVFPVALVCIKRVDFILLLPMSRSLFLALAKGLHPREPVIGLLVQILGIRFISSSHPAPPFRRQF